MTALVNVQRFDNQIKLTCTKQRCLSHHLTTSLHLHFTLTMKTKEILDSIMRLPVCKHGKPLRNFFSSFSREFPLTLNCCLMLLTSCRVSLKLLTTEISFLKEIEQKSKYCDGCPHCFSRSSEIKCHDPLRKEFLLHTTALLNIDASPGPSAIINMDDCGALNCVG